MFNTLINISKRVVKRSRTFERIAFKFYEFNRIRGDKKEFYSRIKHTNVAKCIDTSAKPDFNVIIVTIDSLRYSNLSFAGYPRETSPFLDSLKAKFRAYSPAPWTHPAVASILTGLYPHNHNAYIHSKIRNLDNLRDLRPIKRSILTLPEILFALGYDIYFGTGIDVATYPLRGRVIPKRYLEYVPAEKPLNDLKRWIKKRKGPFFAYLHLGDLHGPLIIHKKFKKFFGEVKDLPNIANWDFRRPGEQKGEKFEEYKYNRILLYDSMLRYVDHALEKFYEFLKASGLLDSTIFVITADHGDEFWEHARIEAENFYDPRGYCGVGHGHNLFNEIIEVPLLLDGAVERENHGERASLVDITPTILDLLEVSHDLSFDGNNIFKGGTDKPLLSEAIAYGYEKKALIVGRYKLLYAPEDGVRWLFDLEKDPLEEKPIKDEDIIKKFVLNLENILRENIRKKMKQISKNLKNSKRDLASKSL